MYKLASPIFFTVETPLHVGSGADLGIVDLPIQRERHTNFPKIEASGLKGAIRESFRSHKDKAISDRKLIDLVFGPDQGDLHAGAVGFTDTRILLFPVKSMQGVFAWITCPAVLNRLVRDLSLAGVKVPEKLPGENTVPEKSGLLIGNDKVILEEYAFSPKKDGACSRLANWLSANVFPQDQELTLWREKLKTDLVILSNDDFRDFVTHSTEVVTRTRIDQDTGTVQDGALFTEEYLPVETVLYTLALVGPIFVKDDEKKGPFRANGDKDEEQLVLTYLFRGLPQVLQIGGNATLGKGFVRVCPVVAPGKEA